jgi:hypothetical protein
MMGGFSDGKSFRWMGSGSRLKAESLADDKKTVWEQVVKDADFLVERAYIPGGWLVRVTQKGVNKCAVKGGNVRNVPGNPIVTTTFAFDPNHVWDLVKKN